MGRVEARLRAGARTLHADLVASTVATALSERAVPFLLGAPSRFCAGANAPVAHLMDVDLLVRPSRLAEAESAPRAFPFAPATTPGDFPFRGNPHAHELRRADRRAVDLHHTISGSAQARSS